MIEGWRRHRRETLLAGVADDADDTPAADPTDRASDGGLAQEEPIRESAADDRRRRRIEPGIVAADLTFEKRNLQRGEVACADLPVDGHQRLVGASPVDRELGGRIVCAAREHVADRGCADASNLAKSIERGQLPRRHRFGAFSP